MKTKSTPDWEIALNKFLLPWQKKSYVTGALVCGSRIHGTDTENSDIDLHIILSNQTTWRERGNCLVNGFLIEYFCNPIAQHYEYMKEDISSFSRINLRMLAFGQIVFDKDGSLSKLKTESLNKFNKQFRKLSKAEIELGKYALWDGLDNLQDLNILNSKFYQHSHHLLLHQTLELYRRFLGVEIGPSSKIVRFFTDKDFRKKYQLKEFPDKKFTQLFVKAIESETLLSIKNLIEHVFVKMGGFKIDSWKFRSKVQNNKKM
jgi:hypothetical protein